MYEMNKEEMVPILCCRVKKKKKTDQIWLTLFFFFQNTSRSDGGAEPSLSCADTVRLVEQHPHQRVSQHRFLGRLTAASWINWVHFTFPLRVMVTLFLISISISYSSSEMPLQTTQSHLRATSAPSKRPILVLWAARACRWHLPWNTSFCPWCDSLETW